MEDIFLKNLDRETVLKLPEQVSFLPGQIVSRTLAQNSAVSLTLFAFDSGEEISTHESHGDALVIALEGAGEITIDGEKQILRAGESMVMPANHPHAVFAPEPFKMFLIVVFPQNRKES